MSFGAHMTQIAFPRDRKRDSLFGGMRKKSLQELKEQQLALYVEQVCSVKYDLLVDLPVAHTFSPNAFIGVSNARDFHRACFGGQSEAIPRLRLFLRDRCKSWTFGSVWILACE